MHKSPDRKQEGSLLYQALNQEGTSKPDSKKSTDKAVAEEQFKLGEKYYNGGEGVDKDHAKAFEHYSNASGYNHAGAQFKIGLMYQNGEGVNKDYTKAFEWYQKSAENGNATAQYLMGNLHKSEGVNYDPYIAIEWYKRAAYQGEVLAQYDLGVMYYNGKGIKQDLSEAKEWFGMACDSGFPPGCEIYRELNLKGY